MDIQTLLSSDNYHTRFYPYGARTSTIPKYSCRLRAVNRAVRRPVLHDIQLNSRSQSSCCAFFGRELELCGVVVKNESSSEVEVEVKELPHEIRDAKAGRKEGSAIENGDSGEGERNDDDLRHARFEGAGCETDERQAGFTALADLELMPTLPLTPPYEHTTENDLTPGSRSRSKARYTPDIRGKSLEVETPPKPKIEKDSNNINNDPSENDATIVPGIPRPRKRQKSSSLSSPPKHPNRRTTHQGLPEEDVLARRRSQLRRSQATYRARRELAITSLRSQVEVLEATQKEMRGLLVELWRELGRRGVLVSDSDSGIGIGCDGEGVGEGEVGTAGGEGDGEEDWEERQIRAFLGRLKSDGIECS